MWAAIVTWGRRLVVIVPILWQGWQYWRKVKKAKNEAMRDENKRLREALIHEKNRRLAGKAAEKLDDRLGEPFSERKERILRDARDAAGGPDPGGGC